MMGKSARGLRPRITTEVISPAKGVPCMIKEGPLVLLFLAICLSLASAPVYGLSCEGTIVDKDATKSEVREACGEPACIRSPKDTFVDKAGIFVPLAMDEEWIYNPGAGRFVHYVRFYQGKVVDVRSGGFGWSGDRECGEIPPPR